MWSQRKAPLAHLGLTRKLQKEGGNYPSRKSFLNVGILSMAPSYMQ